MIVVDMSQPWNILDSLERWAEVLSKHIRSLNIPDKEMKVMRENCKWERRGGKGEWLEGTGGGGGGGGEGGTDGGERVERGVVGRGREGGYNYTKKGKWEGIESLKLGAKVNVCIKERGIL